MTPRNGDPVPSRKPNLHKIFVRIQPADHVFSHSAANSHRVRSPVLPKNECDSWNQETTSWYELHQTTELAALTAAWLATKGVRPPSGHLTSKDHGGGDLYDRARQVLLRSGRPGCCKHIFDLGGRAVFSRHAARRLLDNEVRRRFEFINGRNTDNTGIVRQVRELADERSAWELIRVSWHEFLSEKNKTKRTEHTFPADNPQFYLKQIAFIVSVTSECTVIGQNQS